MANIYKDKKRNCWRCDKVVAHKLNANGEEIPVRKTFLGKTKDEIEKKIDAYKERDAAGLSHKTQYFGIMMDNWINSFFMADGSIKDSTKIIYHDAWRKYILDPEKPHPINLKPINEITAVTWQTTYNDLFASGCSTATLKKLHKLLRRFYKYVEAEGLGRDVTRSLTIPKEQKHEESTITVWTDEEIKTILGGFSKADSRFRFRFLIVLLYYTGCRYSELMGLRYDDFTDDGIRINKQLGKKLDGIQEGRAAFSLAVTNTKTDSSVRVMPITEKILEELRIHKAWHLKEQAKNNYRTDFVFTTASGEFYDHRNVTRALQRYYEKVGVEEKTIHSYRHTFGTNLCRAGVPIQTASKLLGHDDISVTAKYYVNVSADEKLNAVKQLETILNNKNADKMRTLDVLE